MVVITVYRSQTFFPFLYFSLGLGKALLIAHKANWPCNCSPNRRLFASTAVYTGSFFNCTGSLNLHGFTETALYRPLGEVMVQDDSSNHRMRV